MVRRLYDESGEMIKDEEGEEFAGFEVSDERSIFFEPKGMDEDAPTIGSPIPENELKAIVAKAASFLSEGDEVSLFFSERKFNDNGEIMSDYAGGIISEGKMAGEFKSALVEKIYTKYKGFFASAIVTEEDAPVMVTISFSKAENKGSVKI